MAGIAPGYAAAQGRNDVQYYIARVGLRIMMLTPHLPVIRVWDCASPERIQQQMDIQRLFFLEKHIRCCVGGPWDRTPGTCRGRSKAL